MLNGKRVMAIIPARGGSKGLPGKNVRELAGKPLVVWSIEKALKSEYVDVAVVSTDSPAIAAIAAQAGAAVPFIRPAHLATDEASTFDVVCHALEYYRDVFGIQFEYTVLMEPTSPLREDDDIDRMLANLDDHSDQFDSTVSLGEIGEHPSIVKRVVSDAIEPFCLNVPQTNRRQDNVPAYFPYCVAYIAKTRTLLDEKTFYSRRCMPFFIKRYQNYEIDDIYDFLCVEAVMKHEWAQE